MAQLTRLHHKSWAKIATPWNIFEETNANETKECCVCLDDCSKYLHCSNSTEHIICKDCSEKIVENDIYVQPDASVEVKWKCPICRHDNQMGLWQFLPSTDQAEKKEKAKEKKDEIRYARLRDEVLTRLENRQRERMENRQRERVSESSTIIPREELLNQRGATGPPLRSRHPREAVRIRNMDDRIANNLEDTPSKFRWIKSLPWKNSVVNHFKAWIMYNDDCYGENIYELPPEGSTLRDCKLQHNYDMLKYDTNAPWYNFLNKTHPD